MSESPSLVEPMFRTTASGSMECLWNGIWTSIPTPAATRIAALEAALKKAQAFIAVNANSIPHQRGHPHVNDVLARIDAVLSEPEAPDAGR